MLLHAVLCYLPLGRGGSAGSYIYIYTHVCIYICMCMYIYIYIYTHTYMYLSISLSLSLSIQIYTYMNIHIYIYICMYAHIYIYIHICVCIYIYICRSSCFCSCGRSTDWPDPQYETWPRQEPPSRVFKGFLKKTVFCKRFSGEQASGNWLLTSSHFPNPILRSMKSWPRQEPLPGRGQEGRGLQLREAEGSWRTPAPATGQASNSKHKFRQAPNFKHASFEANSTPASATGSRRLPANPRPPSRAIMGIRLDCVIYSYFCSRCV